MCAFVKNFFSPQADRLPRSSVLTAQAHAASLRGSRRDTAMYRTVAPARERILLPPGGSWQNSALRNRILTEDCARRRVHASNRRSRLLASRRNSGGDLRSLHLSRLTPTRKVSPFLFRPSVRTGAPSPRGKGSLRSGAAAQGFSDSLTGPPMK